MTTKAGTEKCDLPCLQRKRVKDRERERMEEQGKNEEKKKLMVAIDESEFSQYAFNWALENLRDTIQSSQLVVFTAQPIDFASTYAASYGAAPAELVTSLLENHKKVALALLEKAKEICAKHGIVAETVTEVGDPKVVICEAVEKHNIQLLVLGSHGRGGIQRKKNGKLGKTLFCCPGYYWKNYLTWIVDTKIHLEVGNLGETIREENSASSQDLAKVMIFVHRHLNEGLKSEYLIVEDPLALWNALRNKYNHHKTMILPRARYAWTHLRIQDFKLVAEYNYAMFIISSKMKLYGETITDEYMLEKTFRTFHVFNVLMQQQYRERDFIEYNQLIYVLMVAEQNN